MPLVASTPSDFSGSQNPVILPRGRQQSGPVGMNIGETFPSDNNMPGNRNAPFKAKEKQANSGGSLS